MIKKYAVLAVAAFFAVGMYVGNVVAGQGPETMVLAESGKKPANFPHWAHQEKNPCGTCHHGKTDDWKKVDYTEGMEIQGCVTCHNADHPNAKLQDFKSVGHALCKECHKANNGPTKCNDCHVKGKKKKLEGC